MIANFNDETNSPFKLLLIYRQIARLLKAFTNNSSVNTKL